MLQFVLQGREPGQRLLRNWTKRTRTYGKQNFGESKLDNITVWNQWGLHQGLLSLLWTESSPLP